MRKLSVKEKNRMKQYPETESFLFLNENPNGNIEGDCVVRAVSTLLDKPWDDVYDDLCELGKKYKMMPNSKKVYTKYIESHGFVKHKQPRKYDNTKYTGEEFCDHLSVNNGDGSFGKVLAHIGGHHVVCIEPTNHGDGINCRYKVRDTWDSTDGCIGNYWAKE